MLLVLKIAQWLVRVIGVLLLIMGLAIWFAGAAGMIEMHRSLGIVLVVSLLVVAGVSTQLGAPIGMAAGLAALAIVILVFGMSQRAIVAPENFWIIQILHPLVGLAGVGFSEAVCARVKRARLMGAAA